jgi:hypothetical protein
MPRTSYTPLTLHSFQYVRDPRLLRSVQKLRQHFRMRHRSLYLEYCVWYSRYTVVVSTYRDNGEDRRNNPLLLLVSDTQLGAWLRSHWTWPYCCFLSPANSTLDGFYFAGNLLNYTVLSRVRLTMFEKRGMVRLHYILTENRKEDDLILSRTI